MVGSVATLWRYPVKSMRGERPASAAVDRRGLVGDRLWAVWDAEGRFGSCKDSRRFRRMDGLLDFGTAYPDDPVEAADCEPQLVAPDGTRYPVPSAAADSAVRAHLRRGDVRLAPEGDTPHHDAAPLHLVSTATLDWYRQALEDVPTDERRLRPNLVVRLPGAAAFAEDGWAGRRLRIGQGPGAVLARWAKTTERCRTLNVAQDDLPYTSRGLKSLAGRDLNLGVYLEVLEGGRVHVGDPIAVEADHG
ncbi:MOSC domain-containing protein [Catenulispora yoronensis]|uniref:MOSC domain-containing protein n=1 Tax=Catenulispora yoronensis TaxID=450799 RepID=A0ABN2TR71_9ACTN